jgi:ADP-ribosyl-[dinitrogen reductase] hydrolase
MSTDVHLRVLDPDLQPIRPITPSLVPACSGRQGLADRSRATLLAGAIGDALGRPGETMPRQQVRKRWGRLTDFHPWHGWRGGPIGTITDDTQLTIVIAEALLAGGGHIDPDDLARRLLEWWPNGRGVGSAVGGAMRNLASGVAWHQAGIASAGNGAAMRVAPIGIVHHDRLDRLRDECIVSSVVTHRDSTAILAAVAQAAMVAWCLRNPAVEPISGGLLTELERVLSTMNDPPLRERHDRREGTRVRLGDRLQQMPDLLDREADEVVDLLWNGAFVIESLPVALWAFLRYWNDPEELLVTTASMGHDSDTIAAMAGSLAGALHGTDWVPTRWLDKLEYRNELIGLPDDLVAARE